MNRTGVIGNGASALALLTASLGSNAWAAEAARSQGETALEEVVVTAQRTTESLQRAAVAVDVVSGEALLANGANQPSQLAALVPSLTVTGGGGANTIYFIRGVGNFTNNGYTDPAIAFNVDGVYLGRPTSSSNTLYDIDRIEVLKGPQGTLYGRNATAGAINVLPTRPKVGERSGYAAIDIGNYGERALQAVLNAPTGAGSAVRVAINSVDHNGYLSDGTSDEKSRAIRAQWQTELSTGTSLRISGDYANEGGKGPGSTYILSYRFNPATSAFIVTPAGFSNNIGLYDPASQAYRQTLFSGLTGRNLDPLYSNVYRDDRFYGLTAEFTGVTGAGTVTVVPAIRQAKLSDMFGSPAFIGYIQETDRQQSLEVRFNGNRLGLFDYILGAYYFNETVDGNYTFAQQSLNAYQEFSMNTRSYALFGRMTANVSDRLRLVAGARYTNDRKRDDGAANVISVACTLTVAGRPSCPSAPLLPVTDTPEQLPFAVPALGSAPVPIIGSAGFTGAVAARATTTINATLPASRVTYRGAIEYDLAPQSLLYASYETGYHSGGFALSFGHETYEPEYISAWTLGSKNRMFNDRLQVNLEAFLWKYRNQQVTHSGIDARGNQGFFTQNIGESTNKGIEVEVQARPEERTLLGLQAQYLDAVYDSLVYTVPLGNAPPFVGCPVTRATNATVYTVDCSGFPAYNSPKWSINLRARHDFPVGANKLFVEASSAYAGEQYVSFEYLPFQLAPSRWTSSLQLGLEQADRKWSVVGYVRNIEDKRNPVFGPTYAIGSTATVISSPPRTYGVRLTAKF